MAGGHARHDIPSTKRIVIVAEQVVKPKTDRWDGEYGKFKLAVGQDSIRISRAGIARLRAVAEINSALGGGVRPRFRARASGEQRAKQRDPSGRACLQLGHDRVEKDGRPQMCRKRVYV